MSTRLRLIAALLVMVLAAGAGIAASIVSAPTPTLVGSWGGQRCMQVTVAHPVVSPNQGRGRYGGMPYPETVTASQRINLLLVRHFSTVSSGVTLSNDNATINIYTVAIPRRLRVAVAKLAPRGSVSYYRCGNTLSSLDGIQRDLNVESAALDRQSIDVVGYGTTITSNCEEIDVLRLTRPQLTLLRSDFGSNRICVHGVTRQQLGVPL